jgi:coenzyme PQQ precursor peptide PqqA
MKIMMPNWCFSQRPACFKSGESHRLTERGSGSSLRDSATSGNIPLIYNQRLEKIIMWSKPEYTEMRFGFEVTMYIANR